MYLIGWRMDGLLGSRSSVTAFTAFLLMLVGAYVGALVVTRLIAATPLAVIVGESRQPITWRWRGHGGPRHRTRPTCEPAMPEQAA